MHPFGYANVRLGVHVPQVGNLWSNLSFAVSFLMSKQLVRMGIQTN